jgi:quinoprotein glucose dehydrogenase
VKALPNGSAGVPAVYEAGGREYILFSIVGGNTFPAGGRMGSGGVSAPANPNSKSYIAFALPK